MTIHIDWKLIVGKKWERNYKEIKGQRSVCVQVVVTGGSTGKDTTSTPVFLLVKEDHWIL